MGPVAVRRALVLIAALAALGLRQAETGVRSLQGPAATTASVWRLEASGDGTYWVEALGRSVTLRRRVTAGRVVVSAGAVRLEWGRGRALALPTRLQPPPSVQRALAVGLAWNRRTAAAAGAVVSDCVELLRNGYICRLLPGAPAC